MRRNSFKSVLSICCASFLLCTTLQLAEPSRLVASTSRGDPCSSLALSPNFSRDGTAYCAGIDREQETAGQYAVVVWKTQNRGRSWQRMAASGMQGATGIDDFLHSPKGVAEPELFIRTNRGLWRSADSGESFALIDTLASDSHANLLSPFISQSNLLGGGAHTAFAFADQDLPAVIDPPLHIPVTATPGYEEQFLIPASYPDSPAFAIGTDRQTVIKPTLYRCETGFSCGIPLFTFPGSGFPVDAWFAPDYETSSEIYVLVRSFPGEQHLHMWRSQDGGLTFKPMESVNRLIRPVNKHSSASGFNSVTLAMNPAFPSRYYLRIDSPITKAFPPAPPSHQLFRSGDKGLTWKRVSYGLGGSQKGRPGRLPWNRAAGQPSWPIELASDGRLFAIGEHSPTKRYKGLYCSTDQGVTWAFLCRK